VYFGIIFTDADVLSVMGARWWWWWYATTCFWFPWISPFWRFMAILEWVINLQDQVRLWDENKMQLTILPQFLPYLM